MFNYTISFSEAKKNIISIGLHISNISTHSLEIKIPAWRPGKYQIQNFSKDIYQVKATNSKGKLLKINKDTWRIEDIEGDNVFIEYSYFANELNAGSSFVSDKLIYLNPINFCFYIEKAASYTINLKGCGNMKIASGQEFNLMDNDVLLEFENHHQLFDNPILISPFLETIKLNIRNYEFWFSVSGPNQIDIARLKQDFEAFTRYQIEIFGEFPEKNYHFILLLVDKPFYHGVEHSKSTMMVLGPPEADIYGDLLGLACHELFHAWNICKTRPIELCPYDYSKENYFETCFIAEGITSYLGDEILFKTGIYSEDQYIKELEARFKSHFENSDNASLSILESSFDLWLDGYQKGAPERKVSVYQKGAIIAQALDILIQKKFNKKRTIYDVMKGLYEQFPNPNKGYSYKNFKNIAEKVYEGSLKEFFEYYIESNNPIFESFNELLQFQNLNMRKTEFNLISLMKTV